MAISKNTFLKGKMNQDLDARLMPSGEYREAINLSVSRSEGSTVGEFENVVGNKLVVNTTFDVIGYYTDKANNTIYMFITDFYSSSGARAGTSNKCYIVRQNLNTNTYTTLVAGYFLNFNKYFPIHAVNLVEDLLFWTDNNNQPRKINVSLANISNDVNPTHYTNEDQISVAKYAPYEPIKVLNQVTKTNISSVSTSPVVKLVSSVAPTNVQVGDIVTGGDPDNLIDSLITVIGIDDVSPFGFYISAAPPGTIAAGDSVTFTRPTMTNKSSEYVSNYNSGVVSAVGGTAAEADITITGVLDPMITTGMRISCSNNAAHLDDDVHVISVAVVGSNTVIKLDKINALATSDVVIIGHNLNYDAGWKGDDDYLEDKFIRFSYRFKFEDNEYSLMAPFTQIMFIPKQYGLFGGGQASSLENMESAYKSTIVAWMENNINNIQLKIPLPDFNTSSANVRNNLLISEVEVLFKESNALSVKVLDSFDITNVTPVQIGSTHYWNYNYESTKPYKTLPESETVRTYDKVPIAALTQEVIGNRIVYGNYLEKHTGPDSVDYNTYAQEKSIVYENYAQFPNSSLKQNRTYQVGIVLADKYGRQSDVVLSSNDSVENQYGSTVYLPYREEQTATDNVFNWLGDALRIAFNEAIGENPQPNSGEPGIYNGTASSADYNPLGWYSYKIVVKQQEQDYYNVYLPGFINGLPVIQPIERDETYFTTLIGDNINKIPRDFGEIGPSDKIYNSNVNLYVRVNNPTINNRTVGFLPNNVDPFNVQYYPGTRADEVVNLSTMVDAQLGTQPFKPDIPAGLYNSQVTDQTTASAITVTGSGAIPWGTTGKVQSIYDQDQNPLMAKITLGEKAPLDAAERGAMSVGATVTNSTSPTAAALCMMPFLSVSETEPSMSLLDIYWETSSTGYLPTLNSSINSTYGGVTGTTQTTMEFGENIASNTVIGTWNASNETTSSLVFKFKDGAGTVITSNISAVIHEIRDGNNNIRSNSLFQLIAGSNGEFTIKTGAGAKFWYGDTSDTDDSYTFTFRTTYTTGGNFTDDVSTVTATLQNCKPDIDNCSDPTITVSDTDIKTFTGDNGSADTANDEEQIIWSIVSQTAAGSATSIFSINSLSGALTTTGVAENITYVIVVRLSDTNNEDTSLYEDCSISFTVGAQHTTQAICGKYQGSKTAYSCGESAEIHFRNTNGASTSGNYPTDNNSSITYGNRSVNNYYNVVNGWNAATVGNNSMLGGLNAGAKMYIIPTLQVTYNSSCGTNPSAVTYYTIQYRSTTNGAWTAAVPTSDSPTSASTPLPYATYLSASSVGGGTGYGQSTFYFDTPGEYRVLFDNVTGPICSTSCAANASVYAEYGDANYAASNCAAGPK